jgi:transposase-like protein
MENKKDKIKSQEEELKGRLKAHLYSKQPLFGKDSPVSELLQGMVNMMLEGEMDAFQASEKALNKKNKRNGRTSKRVISESGSLEISTPRDRNGDFEPELIGKGERVLTSGLDDQIIALYAQGNSVEDVRRLLMKIYGVELSSGKISQITDKVLPQIQEWQGRRLQAFYPIVYLDAIHFKVRYEGRYESRAFYTVYAVDWEGGRDLLGMYVQGQEGARNWGHVLEDLKKRGVEDILVICTDDLTGFSSVIGDVFERSIVQKCIVHQVRNSLKYVDEKDRKQVASGLRKIYTCSNRVQAKIALSTFAHKWRDKYKYIVDQWESKWEELMAFMDFPEPMRRMIYTTNPVEALHRIIRKIVKGKAAWVSDTALVKQLYLALMHNKKSWQRKAFKWKSIQRALIELYPDRTQAGG